MLDWRVKSVCCRYSISVVPRKFNLKSKNPKNDSKIKILRCWLNSQFNFLSLKQEKLKDERIEKALIIEEIRGDVKGLMEVIG